jgi:hypothetical protein
MIPEHNMHHISDIFGGMHGGHERGWYGPAGEELKSWDQAIKVLREGWPKGAERSKKLADSIAALLPEPETARRRPRWNDDDGGELDRDRLYTSGVETAFRGTTRVKLRAPRAIKIVANWSMHCGYTGEQVAWNGAAIAALCDLLERADYAAELSLMFATDHYSEGNHIVCVVVRVKTAGEPLSMNAIAAVAGHAGIYRSLGFAAECTTPNQAQFGLGSCLKAKDAWTQAVESGVVEPVEAFMELSASQEDAEKQVKRVLRQIFPDMDLPLSAKELEKQAKQRKTMKSYFTTPEQWRSWYKGQVAYNGLEETVEQYGPMDD